MARHLVVGSNAPSQHTRVLQVLASQRPSPSSGKSFSPCIAIHPYVKRDYYDLDEDDWILAHERGKLVLNCLKGYLKVQFGTDILQDWHKVDIESKTAMLKYIHNKFPMLPEKRFSEKVAFEKMGKIQRTRKNQIRSAVRDGLAKPTWVSKKDWITANKEFRKNPNKFTQ
ncbi:hypothetical protein GOP47_0017718 [Adiantum capillus-veneris]|uniref:Uncharacterized protein n=1 Tax=Adiantum capillus-veneris TaxID=13818 RepID=A0A9D4UG00_ADICA|nr:hypothetical protein GOP47_0017718 [Adiantum capillus-veneris]